MAEATHERPPVATLVRSFADFVSADEDVVFEALVKRLSSDVSEASFSLVDPQGRLIVVQGNWWLRGEWRVSRDPAGSDIEYDIVNAAARGRWFGRMTGGRALKDASRQFTEIIESVRTEVE
jgi:hypothetical protein